MSILPWLVLSVVIVDENKSQLAAEVSAQEHLDVSASIWSRALFDVAFDAPDEDVFEWWNRGRAKFEWHDKPWRAVMSGDFWWGATTKHDESPFLVFNGRDTRWHQNFVLREAYGLWRRGPWDVAVGERIYTWGKTDFAPAADVLNPIDLRFDPTALVTQPRSSKLPVFALESSYQADFARLQAVVVPFFRGHRVPSRGRDFSLAPPGSTLRARLDTLDATVPVSSGLLDAMARDQEPAVHPKNTSAALRASGNVWRWDWALTGFYGYSRTPRVRVSPFLRAALDSDVPLDPLTAASLAGSLSDDVRITYHRMWLVAFEAERPVGDIILRGDVGFSPRRPFLTPTFDSFRRPWASANAGAEYTFGDGFFLSLTAVSQIVFDPPDISDPTFSPWTLGELEMGALYGGALVFRWAPGAGRWEASATGVWLRKPGDVFATARVQRRFGDIHALGVGAFVTDGPRNTLGRAFKPNAYVHVEYQAMF